MYHLFPKNSKNGRLYSIEYRDSVQNKHCARGCLVDCVLIIIRWQEKLDDTEKSNAEQNCLHSQIILDWTVLTCDPGLLHQDGINSTALLVIAPLPDVI